MGSFGIPCINSGQSEIKAQAKLCKTITYAKGKQCEYYWLEIKHVTITDYSKVWWNENSIISVTVFQTSGGLLFLCKFLPGMLHKWNSMTMMLLSCSSQLQFSVAVLSCSSQLQFSVAVLSCSSQLQFSVAVLSCSSQLQFSVALLSCGSQLHFSVAVLSCSSQLQFSVAVLSCSSQLQFSVAVLSCSSQLQFSGIWRLFVGFDVPWIKKQVVLFLKIFICQTPLIWPWIHGLHWKKSQLSELPDFMKLTW